MDTSMDDAARRIIFKELDKMPLGRPWVSDTHGEEIADEIRELLKDSPARVFLKETVYRAILLGNVPALKVLMSRDSGFKPFRFTEECVYEGNFVMVKAVALEVAIRRESIQGYREILRHAIAVAKGKCGKFRTTFCPIEADGVPIALDDIRAHLKDKASHPKNLRLLIKERAVFVKKQDAHAIPISFAKLIAGERKRKREEV